MQRRLQRRPRPRQGIRAGSGAARRTSCPDRCVPAPAPSSGSRALVVPADFRIYHLTGHGPLSLELDQLIEAQGLEIELLEDVDELVELLGALPADLVLIDAGFSDQLERMGHRCTWPAQRISKRGCCWSPSAKPTTSRLRLSARRAGVDALRGPSATPSDILKRLQPLLDPERQDSFRVLIVEDDRSQALFAEGILRNAGMDSLVVTDALDVMPALEQFRPGHDTDGLEHARRQRHRADCADPRREEFAHTPIVFLSGESSEDLQFDAIDAGGDDFLSKPIRPRHLISAVQTRVRGIARWRIAGSSARIAMPRRDWSIASALLDLVEQRPAVRTGWRPGIPGDGRPGPVA